MANGKTNTARRREVRRTVPKPESAWLTLLRRKDVGWAILFCIAFGAVGGFMVITARERLGYQPGQLITRPVITRVAFTAINRKETEARKEKARQATPAVYRHNQTYRQLLQTQLTNLIGLAKYPTIQDVPVEQRTRLDLTTPALKQLQRLVNPDGQPFDSWGDYTNEFLQRIFDLAILDDIEYQDTGTDFGAGRIVIIDPLPRDGEPEEQNLYANAFFSVNNIDKLQMELRRQVDKSFPGALLDTVVALVMADPQPTYLRDADLTEQRQLEAYNREKDVTHNYQASAVLVEASTILTQTELDRLEQEQHAFQASEGTTQRWLTRTGMIGLILLIGMSIWGYIFACNTKIARNPMRGMGITALLLLCQALAVSGTQLWPSLSFATATFPTLLVAIVLAIVYDQRFALAIGAIHAGLIMVSLSLPIGFGLVLLVGVGLAIAQLREVRSRSKLALVGIWSGLAMGGAALIVGMGTRPLYIEGEINRIMLDALAAASSGLLVGLFVQGILPVIEVVFKVTTAMTLKELNDASHPLLQRLAQEAPGTYQHSLRIADMAEAAAEAIGADGLLCRVGAMYHDIGKSNKPAYFIENQGGGPNRHSKLSPAMSLLIIVGHVKDGVEMAREFGLPQVLRHFIESHHGTTLVEYFYHAARKQQEAEDKPSPSEFEFRYPGPKPQTREAAIMLLCDSIEAAARTLDEPTPVRLEQAVHNIANKRLMDDQFDESNLTLADLHKIEQAITKTLCAIYHARIKYPSDTEEPAASQAS